MRDFGAGRSRLRAEEFARAQPAGRRDLRAPVSEQELRDQLTHSQLALDHDAATRAGLEKQAEGTAAELSRLRTDLAFFRRQHDKSD